MEKLPIKMNLIYKKAVLKYIYIAMNVFSFVCWISTIFIFALYTTFCFKRKLYRNDNSIMNNVQLFFYDLNIITITNDNTFNIKPLKVVCYSKLGTERDSTIILENGELLNDSFDEGKGYIYIKVFKNNVPIVGFLTSSSQCYYSFDYHLNFKEEQGKTIVEYKIDGPSELEIDTLSKNIIIQKYSN